MIQFDYQISDPVGLHMRPAKQLVEYVSTLNSKISIIHNGRCVHINNNILRIITIGIVSGSEVTFRVEGGDECANAENLQKKVCEIL